MAADHQNDCAATWTLGVKKEWRYKVDIGIKSRSTRNFILEDKPHFGLERLLPTWPGITRSFNTLSSSWNSWFEIIHVAELIRVILMTREENNSAKIVELPDSLIWNDWIKFFCQENFLQIYLPYYEQN